MKWPRSVRFSVYAACSVAGFCLGLLTLIWRDWIEALFGFDPDGGNGLAEWALVATLFSVGAVAALRARRAFALRSKEPFTSAPTAS